MAVVLQRHEPGINPDPVAVIVPTSPLSSVAIAVTVRTFLRPGIVTEREGYRRRKVEGDQPTRAGREVDDSPNYPRPERSSVGRPWKVAATEARGVFWLCERIHTIGAGFSSPGSNERRVAS